MTTQEMVDFACKTLYDRKGNDIITLDITGLTIIADSFVIASGKSTTQVRALAERVEERFTELGIEPLRKEGLRDGRWAILDYGNVVIHVFNDEMRMFYCLERLWEDGNNLTRYVGEEE